MIGGRPYHAEDIPSRLTFFWSIIVASTLLGGITLLSSGLRPVSSATEPAKQSRALKAVGQANPYIKLKESRDLQPSYAGAGAATLSSAMLGSKMRPLAMASADLNDDGYPDLVCGYGSAGGGMLTLYRGDPQVTVTIHDNEAPVLRVIQSAKNSVTKYHGPRTTDEL